MIILFIQENLSGLLNLFLSFSYDSFGVVYRNKDIQTDLL